MLNCTQKSKLTPFDKDLFFFLYSASSKTLAQTTYKMWIHGMHQSLGRILQKQAMGKSRAEDDELCLET